MRSNQIGTTSDRKFATVKLSHAPSVERASDGASDRAKKGFKGAAVNANGKLTIRATRATEPSWEFNSKDNKCDASTSSCITTENKFVKKMETRRMSLVKLSSQAAASLPNVGGAACISNLHNGHLEQTYANLVHLMLPFLFHMSSCDFFRP